MIAYCDKCEAVEDENQEDFAARKPKFSLAVRLDSQNVASTVEHNDRGAHCSHGNVISPVFQDKIERCDLKRNEQSLVQEEIPSSHEAYSLS